MNKKNGKAILTTLVLSAMAASTFAAGVNNTVDPNATGYGAESYGKDNVITTTGTSAFAAGFENTVSGANSLVYGHNNKATGANSLAGGENSEAKGYSSVAIGSSAQALTDYTFAIGAQSRANGTNAVSIGNGAYASNDNALAVGASTVADGKDSLVFGSHSEAHSDHAVAVGTAVITNDKDSVGIGHGVTTNKSNSVALGNGVVNTNSNTIGIGNGVTADTNAIAIGNGAGANNINTIAIGNGVNANSTTSVAIGYGLTTDGVDSVNIGNVNKGASKDSVLIGAFNNVNHSDHLEDPEGDVLIGNTNTVQDGYYATVLGKDNKVDNANYAVAIGHKASVAANESVAIGHESTADTVIGTSSADIAGKTYNFAGSTPIGTVSIGDAGKERTITNVAAGRISDTSTDAINGSQLHAVVSEVAKNKQNIKDLTVGVNMLGDVVKENQQNIKDVAVGLNMLGDVVNDNTTAIANNTKLANDAMAEAKKHISVAAGDNVAVSEGTNAAGGKEYTVSVKKDLTDMNSVAFGKVTDPKHAVATKDGLIAFDGDVDTKHDANGVTIENRNTLDTASYGIDGMTASGANGTVSFTTTNVDVAGNQIHNVATGTAGTDAVNVDQLNSVVAANKAVESVVADSQVDNIAAVRVTNGKSTGDANAQYGVYVSKNTVRNIAKDAVTFKGDDVIKVTRQVNENGADVVTTTYNGGNAAKVTPLTYKANGGAANTTTLATGLDFTNGSNTTASVAANGVVKFDLNSNLKDLDSAKFNGGVVINNDGINAGNKTITNVAAGQNGTDAVNVNQLTSAIDQVNSNASKLGNVVRANQEEARKGIAGTAALAGLHPLDFDPDHKLDIMAGYGHFHNANAGAVGIAYRPNEDLMFTAGTTFGSDNVINAGVTYKVGARSEVSRSKVAMAKDLAEAKKEIAQLQSDNAKFKAILNAVLGLDLPQEANTVFPDIEENHWAYVAVDDMAKRGLLVGYPDGTFKGDRAVTRYEFAEVIHRAIEKAKELGQTVDSRLVEEFKPELMRYAVEGKKLERVHVNKSTKEVKRDQYGTIITK